MAKTSNNKLYLMKFECTKTLDVEPPIKQFDESPSVFENCRIKLSVIMHMFSVAEPGP